MPVLHPAKHQRGVGLIEVLVAVLVLGIGLLGIAALQSSSLRNNQSASERSMAVIHTYSILERLHANRDDALAGNYNQAFPGDGDACADPGTGSLINNELTTWISEIHISMGSNACGAINCDSGTDICTIQIRWDDSRASGSAAQTLETKVRL